MKQEAVGFKVSATWERIVFVAFKPCGSLISEPFLSMRTENQGAAHSVDFPRTILLPFLPHGFSVKKVRTRLPAFL